MSRHYLFHITPLQHLAPIISSAALQSPAMLARRMPEHRPSWWTSAYWTRRQHALPCSPHGTLLESVHLYFFKHPPQLHRTPSHPSTTWAYLVTDVATLRDASYRFTFSDGDPLITSLTNIYPSGHRFDVIDWSLREHDLWRPQPHDLDLDRRRGASVMVQNTLSLKHILGITVANPEAALQVREHLRAHNLEEMDVIIRPEWF